MSETRSDICQWVCWGASGLAGLFVLLRASGEVPVLAALMAGGALAFLLSVALTRMFCFDKGMPRNLGLALGLEIDDSFKEEAAPAKPVSTPAPKAAEPRPEALSAPEGKPDDLKKIKGIGPKLEALCHAKGIYHFHQIAAWDAAQVAWMDDNLEGFRGRVSRDGWVEQARRLAKDTQTPVQIHDRKGSGDAG
ncbi:MAG: NADH:ubiquinone oxidoreductase [Roseovarius sp.]